MYGMIGICIIFVVCLVLLLLSKNQLVSVYDINDQASLRKKIILYKRLSLITGVIFIIIGGSVVWFHLHDNKKMVTFEHVHGMGYTDKGSLLIAAHDGLLSFNDGKWQIPDVSKNDYMGFSVVDDGFYSSGHPGQDSTLPNPIGIVKSNNGGNTLQTIAFQGEMDFHGMAVGFHTHTIYVLNPETNDILTNPGLFYSTDEAMTWKHARMSGVTGSMTSMATAPNQSNVVVIGTNEGLQVSTDFGNTFNAMFKDIKVTALSFRENGKILVAGTQDGAIFKRLNLVTGKTKNIPLPKFENDAIACVSQDPSQPSKIAILTFRNNIYLTNNDGHEWKLIAKDGSSL